jgi:hypothetical protein
MKIRKKILVTASFSYLLAFSSVFAWWIDHFEVNFNPDTAKAWEALDLTIEAVDKNNVSVTDYEWTVLIFSESDPEAELPIALEENTYTFSSADQWTVVFENSVKFLEKWTQNIHVYDFEDDTVFGIAEAEITKEEVVVNQEIEIISPETGLTIWEDALKVSWTTSKNYQIKIILNWTEEFLTTSDSTWMFEKEITSLSEWENSFVAQILDSDLSVIWESREVKVKVELNTISFKNIKTTPEEIDSEWSFEVEVIATAGLTEVSTIINDVITSLEETWEWIYTASIYAPKEEWNYKIDVVLKDELGHETKELWAWNIKVNAIELEAATVIEPEPKPEPKEEKIDLTISWLKLVELKTRSILTWDKVKWAKSYNVYKKLSDWELELIENVEEEKFEVAITWDEITYEYFAVKALAETLEWEVYEWDLSEATKVKTWPELVLLLIISLFASGLYVASKQKKA